MSRILRRPMFRGGSANSDGVGITSGLNNPRQGYQKAGSVQKNDDVDFDWLRDTGLGNVLNKGIYEYSIKEPLAAIYNLAGVPLNKISEFTTGYNPGFSGERFFNLDMKNRTPDTAAFFGMDTGAKPGMTYKNEKIKEYEDKIKAEKEAAEKAKLYTEPKAQTDLSNVSRKSDFKTVYEDLLPIFKENLGPNSDEYTRQKYLELAKFGLNLLKPTPVGVKPSLTGSIATAAEKPLEGYQNILSKEAQAEMVPKQLAAQAALAETQIGQYGKNLRDLMNLGYTRDQALGILTKADSAAQKKEIDREVESLSSKLQGVKPLAEHKTVKENPLLLDQLAQSIIKYDLPRIAFKILPENKENRKNNEFYFDPVSLEAGKYKNGRLLHPKDPGYNN
jgi:hypothetical protein